MSAPEGTYAERAAREQARQDVDRRMLLKVMEDLVTAVREGTLPAQTGIQYHGNHQVIISLPRGQQEEHGFVFQALQEMFPGGEFIAKWRADGVVKVGSTKKVYDLYEYRVPLREPFPDSKHWPPPDAIPRVEVWGLWRPHECVDFYGVIEGGRPRWRCKVRACNKALPVREARKRGLVS